MDQENEEVTLFAKTTFRNRDVPFGIKRDDRRRHIYVIGKTGMGKTTLIENMVIQDIQNGHGVAFVDPHGDSVEKILNFIPSNRVNDVVYFNPADTEFPIAFNPLEAVDPKYKHLVASGLMGVFTKIWAGVWSARMEYILNNTILALLDSPGNTMLGIVRMYVDKNYRRRIVDNIRDPVVKSFWRDEFANYQDKFRTEAVAPIQNKVGAFLSSSIIRNIVGQTKSAIDLREIMDNQKIFLINLSKGRIGEDSSALLGAMLVTKLQLAAMSRVDIVEEDRKDFYLYVDEFQNFATESFANILSEARKYRLNLIVAHQYIGQLVADRNTKVRDAIFGNVGTMICFRVGADDAEFLEKEFEPTYTMNDLVNLAKWNIYLKLMINGITSQPFSAVGLPPIAAATGNEDKVIAVSRERYGTPSVVVDEKIHKWLGAEFHAEAAKIESESVEEEGMDEHLRFEHPAQTSVPPPAAKPAPIASSPQTPPVARQGGSNVSGRVERKQDRRFSQRKGSQSFNPKTQRDNRDQKIQLERRNRYERDNPGRRSVDQKEKVRDQNPIWETVNKLSAEKLQNKMQATTEALKSLDQEIKTRISQTSKNPSPAPDKSQGLKADFQPGNETTSKTETVSEKIVKKPTLEPKPKNFEIPAEIKRIKKETPPSESSKDESVQAGSIMPGETIKF